MLQRNFKSFFVVFLWVLGMSLMACSSPSERTRSDFYGQMAKAQTSLEDVQSLVKSTKFAKQRYTERVERMIPVAQRALKKYKGTQLEQDPVYQNFKKSFEHYVMADHLWKQNKGLVMVNQRLADAEQALKRGTEALKEGK